MAVKEDIAFDYGETWGIAHTSYQPDGQTPLILSGGSIALQLKDMQTGLPVLTAAGSIISGAAGTSSFAITPAQQLAAGLSSKKYYYTIRATLSSGVVSDQTYGHLGVVANAFSP